MEVTYCRIRNSDGYNFGCTQPTSWWQTAAEWPTRKVKIGGREPSNYTRVTFESYAPWPVVELMQYERPETPQCSYGGSTLYCDGTYRLKVRFREGGWYNNDRFYLAVEKPDGTRWGITDNTGVVSGETVTWTWNSMPNALPGSKLVLVYYPWDLMPEGKIEYVLPLRDSVPPLTLQTREVLPAPAPGMMLIRVESGSSVEFKAEASTALVQVRSWEWLPVDPNQPPLLGDCEPGVNPCTAPVSGAGIMKVTALVDGLERTATAPVGMTSTVSCLPAQVVRGEQVTCTLSPAEAVDRLTQWRFVGEDGNEVTDPVKSAVWEGLAVMGGTVFAELEDETPQGSFTITSRDWSSLVVELLVPQWSVTPNTEASFVPLPLEIHDLGHVDFVRSALDYSVLGTVLSGPNANYIYLTGLPYHVTATIHVHPQLAENTDFFNAQFAYDAGPGKCRQDDVLPFLPVLLAHEGTLREPTSHVGLFEAELEELGGQLVEDAVGYNSAQSIEDAAHAGFTPLFQAADDESARADSEFFPSYCEFRYVYQ